MNPFKYVVSLRVCHPKMMPEEICKVLGMEAHYKWMAGTPRKTKKGTPLEGYYASTYCSFRFDTPENIGLADFLSQCNKTLGVHKDFFRQVRSTGGSLEYLIGWFSEGDSGELFRSELLSELANLQIDLALAVYGETTQLPKIPSKTLHTKKKKAKKKK